MLKANLAFLERLKETAAKADLGIHHILFDRNDRKASLTCNSRNDVLRDRLGRMRNDHRSLIVRTVGIADVDRDSRIADREDRILMENGCSHVGKLAKLLVGDRFNHARILNKTGIRHQKARNVGPVLVKIGVYRACNDRARDIRAAAREGLDRTVRHASVEARNDGAIMLLQDRGKNDIGFLGIKITVLAEEDILLRINEIKAKVICENNSVQILAAAGDVVAPRAMENGGSDGLKFLLKRKIKSELLNDRAVTVFDLFEGFVDLLIGKRELKALVKKVGYLIILRKALSGSRRNDVPAAGLSTNDLPDHAKMCGISKRASAEFQNLKLHSYPLNSMSYIKMSTTGVVVLKWRRE